MATKSSKNEYTLRDGYPFVQGDEVIIGPEILHLSLDQAYAIRGVLEEAYDIAQEWESRNHAKLRAIQVQKRVEMYVRAGIDKGQALEKARAAVLKQEELEKAKAEEVAATAAATDAEPTG